MNTTSLKTLRAEYKETFGYSASRDWTKEEIIKKILAEADRQARVEAEQVATRKKFEQRKARSEERKDIDTWLLNTDNRKSKLGFMVSTALSDIENYEKERNSFIKNIEADPVYALSWSQKFFQATACYKVAKDLIIYFEAGMSEEEIIQAFAEELTTNASLVPASTSQQSNLIDMEITAAIARTSRYW